MSRDLLASALRRLDQGERVVILTLVSTAASTPRDVGARMVLFSDGSFDGTIGGGRLEAIALEVAAEVRESGASRLEDLSLLDLDMECGGHAMVFVERLDPAPRLLLFGGGHVAREVSLLAARWGLSVHVLDDREEWANKERFPEAERVVAAPFLDGLAAIGGIRPSDRVVIVTRGHAHDQLVLEAVVTQPCAYLGMIGSKRKVAIALKALAENGVSSEHIATVRAPIGLDLGGDSPFEIAVAILAEMIALREGRESAASLSMGERMAARAARSEG